MVDAMTPIELLALIDGDTVASGKAAIGDDSGCAARCIVIAPPVRVPVPAAELQYEAMLGMSWGVMKVKASQAEVALEIRALCYQFIDQVQSGRPIDFALPQVSQMLAAMVATGIVSQATADAIIAKSWAPQTITANDVSAAMSPRRPGGRI
jgi:hypothetical protein